MAAPVGRFIHRRLSDGVQRLHPVNRTVGDLSSRGPLGHHAGGQAWELAFQRRQVLVVQVVADQAHGQVQALRAPVSPLDLRGDYRRITGPDDPGLFQSVQGGLQVRSDRQVQRISVQTEGKAPCRRAGVVGQPDQHRLAGRVRLLPRSRGTGARYKSYGIASALTANFSRELARGRNSGRIYAVTYLSVTRWPPPCEPGPAAW
jgi:hypothetical protein